MAISQKRITRWAYVMLSIFVSFLVVACQTSTNTTHTLTVGVSPWSGYSGHYIATANNLFKEAGIDVKQVYFTSQGDADTAFLSGKLDLNWTGLPNVVLQASRDPSIKIIMQTDYSNGADGIVGRSIETAEDLRGKQIAREDILFEELLLRRYLEKMGVARDAVKYSLQDNKTVTFDPNNSASLT